MVINASFIGSLANPIIDARMQVGINSNALAKKLGLSRQYISQAELGIYSSLNPALLRWVSNALDLHKQTVEQKYVLFQKAKRKATIEKFEPNVLRRPENTITPGHTLFANWRSHYWPSAVAFAKDFCIHPEIVSNYEEGLRPEMPILLKRILAESNLIEPNWADWVKPPVAL